MTAPSPIDQSGFSRVASTTAAEAAAMSHSRQSGVPPGVAMT